MLNYAQVLSVTRSKKNKKQNLNPSNKAVSKGSYFSEKRRGETKEDLAISISGSSLIVFCVFNWFLPSEQSLQIIIIRNQMASLLLLCLFILSLLTRAGQHVD